MTQRQKQLIENYVRKHVRKSLREYEDVSTDDFYQGNYEDIEKYKKVLAKGIMVSAKSMADFVSSADLKKRTPINKLLKSFYKSQKDTVDAIPYIIDILKKEHGF